MVGGQVGHLGMTVMSGVGRGTSGVNEFATTRLRASTESTASARRNKCKDVPPSASRTVAGVPGPHGVLVLQGAPTTGVEPAQILILHQAAPIAEVETRRRSPAAAQCAARAT